MCRYRYCYFGACKHQELVLVSFCNDATPLHDAIDETSSDGAGDCDAKEFNDEESRELAEAGATDEQTQEVATIVDRDKAYSSGLTTDRAHYTLSSTSSLASPASITAVPELDAVSLQSQHHSHSSPSTASVHDMTGLPSFGDTFRQWMSGNNSVAGKQDSSSPLSPRAFISGTMSPLRPRCVKQPGIRENTDDSWILPSSNDILQHLAESCRSRDDRHIMPDPPRRTSLASSDLVNDNGTDFENQEDAFDSIEAEIDQLKADVLKLKQEADKTEPASGAPGDPTSEASTEPQVGAKTMSSTSPKRESAAARLQREHEAISREDRHENKSGASFEDSLEDSYEGIRKLNQLDFPILGAPIPSSSLQIPHSSETSDQLRKPSYADAANKYLTNNTSTSSNQTTMANDSDNSPICAVHDPFWTTSTKSQSPLDVSNTMDDDDQSVIIASRNHEDNTAILTSNSNTQSTTGVVLPKAHKQAPHFAQPTQSFSRRTGETLRKNAMSASPKNAAEVSKAKSIKAKDTSLASSKRTTRRQQNQRLSLPVNWLAPSDMDSTASCLPLEEHPTAAVDKTASLSAGASPDTTEPWPAFDERITSGQVQAKSAKSKQLQSPPRKRTSYMSPTTATTQRVIATLGEDKLRCDEPVAKHEMGQAQPVGTSETAASPTRSCTAGSDRSSVQFILERPATVDSPTVPGSPDKDKLQAKREELEETLNKERKEQKMAKHSPATPSKHTRLASRIPKAAIPVAHSSPSPVSENTAPTSPPHVPDDMWSSVANTITTRRTSRGHILRPIITCLVDKGLLNKQPTTNASAWKSITKGTIGSADAGATNAVLAKGFKGEPLTVFIDSRAPLPKKKPAANHTTNSFKKAVWAAANKIVDSNSMTSTSGREVTTKGSSLRATANDFRPALPQFDPVAEVDVDRTLDWKTPEQWMAMEPSHKKDVLQLRGLRDQAGIQSGDTVPVFQSPPEAPHLQNNGVFWPVVKYVDDNGSPNVVQAGQIIRPRFSPEKNTMEWIVYGLDGKETQIRFGRAPPPNNTQHIVPATPNLSPTSDNTSIQSSNQNSPPSSRAWHIGSAVSRTPYGWTGGDGREIRFTGWGPHAELDPNTVVNFNYQGRTSQYRVSVPNGFDEDRRRRRGEGGLRSSRAQVQWAQNMGYPMVPCGNVDVVDAVESLPFGAAQNVRSCHGCAPGY